MLPFDCEPFSPLCSVIFFNGRRELWVFGCKYPVPPFLSRPTHPWEDICVMQVVHSLIQIITQTKYTAQERNNRQTETGRKEAAGNALKLKLWG